MTNAWQATGFGPGTFVQTALGMRPIDQLAVGEELEFRDSTRAPLLHLHSQHFSEDELKASRDLQPFRVPALALGPAVPRRPLLVSGDIHVLAQGRMVTRVVPGDALLLPIAALDGKKGIERVIPAGGMTYYHMLVDRHAMIMAEGLLVDTMFVGHSAEPDKVVTMFEHLDGASHGAACYPIADNKQARTLIEKLVDKDRALISDKVDG